MASSSFPALKLVPTNQHTIAHVDCPACERARLMTLSRISPALPFSVAASIWLESRSFRIDRGYQARYIRESTEQSYRQYVGSLNLWFGDTPLEKIHVGMLREYQEARVTGSGPFVRYRRPQDARPKIAKDGTILPPKGKQPCPCNPKKVNQELSILKMILRRAGAWNQEMDEFYQPFDVRPNEVPRALSIDEQKRWLDVAAFKPRWALVYWYSVLAFDTSMSTNEIRNLRIGDVNMVHRVVQVSEAGAKNKHRQRTIPLESADVLWAVDQLLARAKDLGAKDPKHYLFPFREIPNDADPTRPMTVSGIKRLWSEVREASGLKWFVPYGTRHTALTRWAEKGIPPAVMQARAGHIDERMMKVYVHIFDAVQRRWFSSPMPGERAANQPFYVNPRQIEA